MRLPRTLFLGFLVMMITKNIHSQNNGSGTNFIWNKEKKELQNSYRNDSLKWDMKMFETDKKYMDHFSKPIRDGVFPTPYYDLVGINSFKGLGNHSGYGKIQNKTIFYNSFFVRRSPVNDQYLENGRNDEVFFVIVSLTDTIDTVDYSHFVSQVVSRNHPDYIGQGAIYTKTSTPVEYVSFLTADRNSYAIVNMRLFDLSIGKMVLIAPQKDKTFRSRQVDFPPLSSEDLDQFIEELLKKPEIVSFFTNEGNI